MKKLFHFLILVVSFSTLFPDTALSQQNKIASNAAMAEKIYLQPDNKVYMLGQTILFKSTITNAFNHASTQLSGVLYVELVSLDRMVVEKKLVKLKNGIGDGFFELKKSYTPGIYMIRAFTEWNKNFGQDFIVQEYIRVYASSNMAEAEPITNLSLVEKPNKERHLSANILPLLIDTLHKNDLTLFVTHGEKKDSLTIKRGADNKYEIDYDVPENTPFVKLDVRTKNRLTYSKTLILNEDYLDLQFFPESGELVQGLPGKVGFKALDCRGKGKVVEGDIVDGKGKVVTTFKSNQFGMGSLILANVDSGATYFAKVKSPSTKIQSILYPLPLVSTRGNILSVFKINTELGDVKDSQIGLIALSNYQKSDSVYLQVSCRGLVYFDIKGCLEDGKLMLSLSSKTLPEGVIAFTMMDNSWRPIAERLYFNEKSESRLNVSVSMDSTTYTQRDQTKLTIETTDVKGQPVQSNLSLLVLDKSQMGDIQNIRQNILSYFLLSSDLKGEIETPGLYFREGEDHFNDLDALLLTQGWRKYLYTKPVGDLLTFKPEGGLSVSGTVQGLFFKDIMKNKSLTMLTLGEKRSVQVELSDSKGRFNFNIGDEYGKDMGVVIQTASKSGNKKDYVIELDKKESPALSFDPDLSVRAVEELAKSLVQKNIERKKLDEKFMLSSGEILLNEVVVEGYQMTPERKKAKEEFGDPKLVIDGKDLLKEKRTWRTELFEILKTSFPQTRLSPSIPTLVAVDGVLVSEFEMDYVSKIPITQVTSYEIIENAKDFAAHWMVVHPTSEMPEVRGAVIAIYTRAGKGLSGAYESIGISQKFVPVFSESREFYAPKYEKLQPGDWIKPDTRALVYWSPKLATDSLGKVSTSYYNADNLGAMKIVVEAISDKGEIGYKEIGYDVKERANKGNLLIDIEK